MIAKVFLLFACFSGACAVSFGAFGAHALKGRLSESALQTWGTAVEYQFYHLLALIFVAVLLFQGLGGRFLTASGILFILGSFLFCGSLYGLALGGPRWLGPITPLGGLCFILAWLSLAVAAYRL